MAEILRVEDFKFFIPSNDHAPAHVHVQKGSFATKIDISGSDAEWMAGEEYKRAARDRKLRKRAIQIASENIELLQTKWREIEDERRS